MSRWSSFDDEQAYTDSWRRYLMEESALDEGWRDRVKGVAQGAADKVKSASGHASGAGQKGSAALDSALGKTADIWDSIAGFLGGNPTDKDYSHLRMPAGQIGVADSDAEEEDTSDEPTEPGTPPEEDTTDEPTETGPSDTPDRDPALEEWAANAAREALQDEEWFLREPTVKNSWTAEQREAFDRHMGYIRNKENVISSNPSSARNESQTYGRWKVLSGIKKKVI